MNPSTLPNRLWPFTFHFYRQFPWGCLGLVVFPVLSRGVFASIAYATKRLTDTVLSMHDPAHEAGKVLAPFTFFVGLVVARFAMDAGSVVQLVQHALSDAPAHQRGGVRVHAAAV